MSARSIIADPLADHRVIYDFGMNNGDDVEYYLKKAPRVIGVDANVVLCREASERFADEIREGRLTILPVALTDDPAVNAVSFYLHKNNSVLSQLPRPSEPEMDEFELVQVPARTPSSIIREFGSPLYVKIDVEHVDHLILAELFAARIAPPFISAEAHTIEVFAWLVASGYDSFALVDGASVHQRYRAARIQTLGGEQVHRFRPHSAGPFGEDIEGVWEAADVFVQRLVWEGLGWKDIHASKTMPVRARPRQREMVRRQALALARKLASLLRQ